MKKVRIQSNLEVSPEKVKWVEADVNYSKLYFEDAKSKMCASTLKKVERALEHPMFYRIHRMYLVNISHVDKIDQKGKRVHLAGVSLPIARRRYKDFKRVFSENKYNMSFLQ